MLVDLSAQDHEIAQHDFPRSAPRESPPPRGNQHRVDRLAWGAGSSSPRSTRISEFLSERASPRVFRVAALPAQSDEKTQIYLQRYMQHFPAAGERDLRSQLV